MSVSNLTNLKADFPPANFPVEPILVSPMIASQASPADAALRRALDVVVSAAALLLLLPLLLLVAVCIRLDSPGPILFVQTRVGKGGREFPVFKFRSMFMDAEARLHLVLATNERSGPVFKMRRDPRITRIGRGLRRCSLDEVPQLLNVLRGEMSLVGPRPALPREVVLYTPSQQARLSVLPGLTGLWQVSGRAELSFEASVALDLEYVRRQSVWLNMALLVRTVPAVLTGYGAY
jgi:lipopolysaccharide/colanic/teichoic acid biosynthesis glycosyltransferase